MNKLVYAIQLASALFITSQTIFAKNIKIINDTASTIYLATNYSTENFYRIYESKPTLFNKKPYLHLSTKNLKQIKVFKKIPKTYKNNKRIKLNMTTLLKDSNNQMFRKIFKKKLSRLPNANLELTTNDVKNREIEIMNAPDKKLTFAAISRKLK